MTVQASRVLADALDLPEADRVLIAQQLLEPSDTPLDGRVGQQRDHRCVPGV